MEKLHEKRVIISLLCISLVLIFVLVRIGAMWEMKIKKRDLSEYNAINPGNVEYLLERNEFVLNKQDGKNHIYVDGWIVAHGMDNAPVKIKVVIAEDSNNAYELPTEVSARDDVNEAFDDGFNHKWSGFSVHVVCPKYINIENEDYNVSIIYTIGDTDYLINTEEEVISGEE